MMADGKEEGVYQSWCRSGLPKCKTFFVSGKREGQTVIWNEYDEMTEDCYFREGVKDGLFISWAAGIKTEKSTYANGVIVGLYRRWYFDGELKIRGHYDDQGRMHGEWQERDGKGNLISHVWHENNEKVIEEPYGDTK